MKAHPFFLKPIIISMTLILSWALAGSSSAVTYCVDDFGDGLPNAADCPADCTSSNGNCSLRDVIEAANVSSNLDTVEILAGTVTL